MMLVLLGMYLDFVSKLIKPILPKDGTKSDQMNVVLAVALGAPVVLFFGLICLFL